MVGGIAGGGGTEGAGGEAPRVVPQCGQKRAVGEVKDWQPGHVIGALLNSVYKELHILTWPEPALDRCQRQAAVGGGMITSWG